MWTSLKSCKKTKSDELKDQLFQASIEGNIEKIKDVLSQGVSLDVTHDYYQRTVLHFAAEMGRQSLVQFLLSKGVDTNKKDIYGYTALHLACGNGHERVVNLLLHFGAHIGKRDNKGNTPLHSACWWGHTEAAVSLLKKGAKCDEQDNNGCTPLSAACMSDYSKTAEVLVESGANMSIPDFEGWTPLHWVCYYNHSLTAFVLLAKGAKVNIQDNRGNTPLHRAVTKNLEIVQQLLNHGALVDLKNNDLKTSYDVCQTAISNNSHESLTNIKFELIKHILKLSIAKLPVQINVSEECKANWYIDKQVEYNEELETIKNTTILNQFLLDIVFLRANKPYYLTKQQLLILEKFLYSPNVEENMPVYCYIMRNLFEQSKILTLASESLYSESRKQICKKLPSLVTEKILGYLCEEDLLNIIKSAGCS